MEKKKSIVFSACLIYFIALLLFIGVRILVSVVDFDIDENIIDLTTTVVVQIGLMFILPVFLFSFLQKQKVKKTLSDFNFGKLSISSILIAFLIGFLCYFLNLSIASFFGSLIDMFGYEQAPSFLQSVSNRNTIFLFFFNIITIAVLPAICEETMHRGLLLKGLGSLGIKRAVVLSSILFGLMHLNINQFFYATILGFIIGVAVIISKNIVPGIIIHFMNNFLSVYFSYAIANNWIGSNIYKFMTSYFYSNNIISLFLTNFLVLVLLLMGIVFLFMILLKNTRIKKVEKMLFDIAKINQEYKNGTLDGAGDQNLFNLYNLNNLMGEYNIKSLNSMIFTELEKKTKKLSAYEIILLVGCFLVSGLTTAFTFIWGLL